VTMTWGGHHVVRAYMVHKDLTRIHYNFYPSWRLDIPFATIQLSLPNQPGAISVDGLTLPQGATKSIEVIQGFHTVTMDGTDLYDKASAAADAVEGSANIDGEEGFRQLQDHQVRLSEQDVLRAQHPGL